LFLWHEGVFAIAGTRRFFDTKRAVRRACPSISRANPAACSKQRSSDAGRLDVRGGRGVIVETSKAKLLGIRGGGSRVHPMARRNRYGFAGRSASFEWCE